MVEIAGHEFTDEELRASAEDATRLCRDALDVTGFGVTEGELLALMDAVEEMRMQAALLYAWSSEMLAFTWDAEAGEVRVHPGRVSS